MKLLVMVIFGAWIAQVIETACTSFQGKQIVMDRARNGLGM